MSFSKMIKLGLEFSMVHVMLIKLQTKARLFWTPLRCLKLDFMSCISNKQNINKYACKWLAGILFRGGGYIVFASA